MISRRFYNYIQGDVMRQVIRELKKYVFHSLPANSTIKPSKYISLSIDLL